MNKSVKETKSAEECVDMLMAIIGSAPDKAIVTDADKDAQAKAFAIAAANKGKTMKIEATGGVCVYSGNTLIEVDGKKITTGPKKKGGKRCLSNDPGRTELRALAKAALKASDTYSNLTFEHSAEGLVLRLLEADYTIKVSKSKEAKFDVNYEDFKAEKDFTTRGKVKNSSPAIARCILAALDNKDTGIKYDLCEAKASGITLQIPQGEYTIKISKKRDRVGFEAEKASAYENKK